MLHTSLVIKEDVEIKRTRGIGKGAPPPKTFLDTQKMPHQGARLQCRFDEQNTIDKIRLIGIAERGVFQKRRGSDDIDKGVTPKKEKQMIKAANDISDIAADTDDRPMRQPPFGKACGKRAGADQGQRVGEPPYDHTGLGLLRLLCGLDLIENLHHADHGEVITERSESDNG